MSRWVSMLSYKVAAYVGSGTELQRQKDRGILVSRVFEDSDSDTRTKKTDLET